MAHFYSIAIFRLDDYKKAGIPVMPAIVGIKNTKFQIIVYVFAYVIAVVDLSLFGYAGITYLVVMAVLSTYWLWKGINGFKARSDAKWARQMFGMSLVVLLVFSVVLALNPLLP
jgi:protoheme IX farnesyltransferase